MAGTNYGINHKGNSRFIIVAPHAAGDDLRTGKIAEIKITLLPFFSEKEKKEMLVEGYIGKLRIVYLQEVL